jgi:hypothetical protein
MTAIAATRTPIWFWIVAGLGLAWNIFGVVQFVGSLGQTVDGLMMGGMTPEQARIYHAMPGWATVAFGTGTIGGVLGCLALLARRAIAVPVFAVSLIAYIALYTADYVYGVFAVLPGQMAVLTMVVGIAAALLAVAAFARRRGLVA